MKAVKPQTSNDIQIFKKFLRDRRKLVNSSLKLHLTSINKGGPKVLATAMKYVALSGGKRFRSLLLYAVGEMYDVDPRLLDAPTCAIEIIHAFSLVHDDLPAMDNDSLRRGKPTCHIAFDESTAILAGDALAIAAFQILSEANLSAEIRIKMCRVLAEVSGPRGMAGGQYIDLHAIGNKPTTKKLEHMYLLKTGALIYAAVKLATLTANVTKKKDLENWDLFALSIGLAFQIQDDILNIESSAAKLGKNVGTDSTHNKITYPALVGIPKAKLKIEQLWGQAEQALHHLKAKNSMLYFLTEHIMQRDF